MAKGKQKRFYTAYLKGGKLFFTPALITQKKEITFIKATNIKAIEKSGIKFSGGRCMKLTPAVKIKRGKKGKFQSGIISFEGIPFDVKRVGRFDLYMVIKISKEVQIYCHIDGMSREIFLKIVE